MRSKYAATLMTTVANAHLWHFYTKSYSSHMAFGGFYESLQDLADAYIEGDIGVHGPIVNTPEPFYYKGLETSINAIKAFKAETKLMRDAQEQAGQNGLVAKLEEIMNLVD